MTLYLIIFIGTTSQTMDFLAKVTYETQTLAFDKSEDFLTKTKGFRKCSDCNVAMYQQCGVSPVKTSEATGSPNRNIWISLNEEPLQSININHYGYFTIISVHQNLGSILSHSKTLLWIIFNNFCLNAWNAECVGRWGCTQDPTTVYCMYHHFLRPPLF